MDTRQSRISGWIGLIATAQIHVGGSRLPLRFVPADVASSRSAQNAVMNGVVPGEAADLAMLAVPLHARM